jgi:hypothetical protein
MSDVVKYTPAIPDDGWDGETEEDRRGIIRGRKVTFTIDNEWVCEGEVIPPDREFIALENIKIVQKWVPWSKGPVDTIPVAAGEQWPDVDTMNAEAPRDEWQEDSSGQLKGPWQKARVLYLLHQETMGVFTYVASTVGGMRAVRDLRESTRLARKLHGPVLATITLANTFMPTRHGGRQRPDLRVVRYVPFGGPEPKQLEQAVPDDDKPKQGNGGALADMVEPKPKAKAKPKAKRTTKAPDVEASFFDDPDEWGEDDLRIQAEEDAGLKPDAA